MAIDRTGISSLETGAPDIKLTGNQDPREPNQKFAGGGQRGWMAQELAMEIAEEEYGREFYDLNDSLQHKIYNRALQEIDDMLIGQAQGKRSIQTASATDPLLEEEYQKYVFEMQEMGQEPMSFEQFRQQAVAGMATGGRAGYRDGYSVQGGVKNYLGDQETVSNVPVKWQSGPDKPDTELAYITKAEKDLILKKDLHGSLQDGPNIGPGGIMSLDSWGDIGGGQAGADVSRDTDRGRDTQRDAATTYSDAVTRSAQAMSPADVKLAEARSGTDYDVFRDKTIDEVKKPSVFDQVKKFKHWATGPVNRLMKNQLTRERIEYLKGIYDWDEEEGFTNLPPELEKLLNTDKLHTDDALQLLNKGGEFEQYKLMDMNNPNLFMKGDLGNFHAAPKPDWFTGSNTEWETKKREIMEDRGLTSGGDGPGETEYERWLRLYGQPGGGGGGTTPITDPVTDPVTDPDPVTATALMNQYHIPGASNFYSNLASTLPTGQTTGTTFDPTAEMLKYYMADGGRAGYAYGGDVRQPYGIGSLVKKIGRTIKKVAKSPIGMAALGTLGFGLAGMGPAKGLAGSSFKKWLLGSKLGADYGLPGNTGFLGKMLLKPNVTEWSMANISPWKAIGGLSALGGLYTGMTEDDEEDDMYKKWLAEKQAADAYWAPRFEDAFADGGRIGYAGAGLAGLSPMGTAANETGFITKKPDWFKDLYLDREGGGGRDFMIPKKHINIMDSSDERFDKWNLRESKQETFERGEGTRLYNKFIKIMDVADSLDPELGNQINKEFLKLVKKKNLGPGDAHYAIIKKYGNILEDKAKGGRIGYKKGGDHTDRQLALNMLSGIRSKAQEGGLMDMGGMEKDYRQEGGFVPIGGQERADDVPARLSKNEFVFTADAVRAAGGGDIDKGAEVMENVMENLEKGGNVSEESQGLEGARNMFATSQRLEGVL